MHGRSRKDGQRRGPGGSGHTGLGVGGEAGDGAMSVTQQQREPPVRDSRIGVPEARPAPTHLAAASVVCRKAGVFFFLLQPSHLKLADPWSLAAGIVIRNSRFCAYPRPHAKSSGIPDAP